MYEKYIMPDDPEYGRITGNQTAEKAPSASSGEADQSPQLKIKPMDAEQIRKQIEKLTEMLNCGLLTREEFDREKMKYLGRL